MRASDSIVERIAVVPARWPDEAPDLRDGYGCIAMDWPNLATDRRAVSQAKRLLDS